ncbi:hypothetical protein GOP47_0005451 [Adiantum capillus-veneris]|uniref:Peptidase A2 domain-containing protein n=1 Tax=Adiantum capillus-veneris TaxID=13818 RepID=A0A9D4ZN89_ADICA|nr:hypothetical protein GOP47_0005451 [Adiantum capillus-veneris]
MHALVDSGADLNIINHDTWISLMEQIDLVDTKVEVSTFADDKKGRMITPVILGTPWQRTYNGVPNWKQQGINFYPEWKDDENEISDIEPSTPTRTTKTSLVASQPEEKTKENWFLMQHG